MYNIKVFQQRFAKESKRWKLKKKQEFGKAETNASRLFYESGTVYRCRFLANPVFYRGGIPFRRLSFRRRSGRRSTSSPGKRSRSFLSSDPTVYSPERDPCNALSAFRNSLHFRRKTDRLQIQNLSYRGFRSSFRAAGGLGLRYVICSNNGHYSQEFSACAGNRSGIRGNFPVRP